MHQSDASYPVKRTIHFASRQLQQHLEAFTRVNIIVDQDDATMNGN